MEILPSNQMFPQQETSFPSRLTRPKDVRLVWLRPIPPPPYEDAPDYGDPHPNQNSDSDESDQLPQYDEHDSEYVMCNNDSECAQCNRNLDYPSSYIEPIKDSNPIDSDRELDIAGPICKIQEPPPKLTKAALRYKKVCEKVRPIPMLIPAHQQTQRKIPVDPLLNLPFLPYHPPEFIPSARITVERMDNLDIANHKELLPEERKLLQHVLLLNQRSIAFEDSERGTFHRSYFSDYIIPVVDHIPWTEDSIPISKKHESEVFKSIRENIKTGLYERSQTPYRSRWFCVEKKNGGIRIVHNLQELNRVTKQDAAIPPHVEDFVESYAGRSVYTVLDMYQGFNARVLDINSRDYTAFTTPIGNFRLTTLPMGYANAPAEFQASMEFILEDEIPDVAGVFIDDIPIKGPPTRYLQPDGTEETLPENPGIRRYIWEHLNDVHRILHRLGEAGGTVAAKKLQLCKSKVSIVGHACSSEGREPVDDRAKKIWSWPIPRNLKELRGFLGLCGTVRIWIKNFSQIARPLVDLTRKGAEYIWGPKQQEAFDRLKALVSSAPALRPIDYYCGRPLILSVDTSIYGIGFILSQEDEQGRRIPARYGSIPLKPHEARYGQSKLELFGLMKALDRFRSYVGNSRRDLIVEVDASSIKGMLKNPDLQPSAIINRWISNIKRYIDNVVHVPATKHVGPDALSRRRHTSEDDEPPDSDLDEWKDPEACVSPVYRTKPLLQSTLLPQLEDSHFSSAETKQMFVAAARPTPINDQQELKDILRYLVTGKTPTFRTAKEQEQFEEKAFPFYLKQTHMYRHQPGHPPQVVIFPEERRRKILWEMHEQSGHHGVWAVEKQVTLRYYWPGMRNQIKQHVQSCHACQLRSTKKMHIPITISHPPSLFSKVYLDVMNMPKARGKQWLIACRDDLSGVTECKAIARAKAKVIARFFLKRIILRYGIVQEVVTDNGPEFSREFAELLKRYGLHHIKITPYNSQANGVVERGHYNIREALVKMSEDNISQWPLMVSAATYADRITTRRSTGFSPYYLLHGTHPLMPGDLADATFLVTDFKTGMTSAELIEARMRQLLRMPEDLERAQRILKQSRFRSKAAYEQKFARRIRLEPYEPGSLVLIRNNPIENSVSIERKTANRYMGPYEVERRTQGGSYILKELDGTILRHHVAAYRLIPYVCRQELNELAEEIGLEDNIESTQDSSDDGDQDTQELSHASTSTP